MTLLPFCDEKFKNIPCVVTVGVFDGVHLGHVAILKECINTAKDLNAQSVVLTFNNNPKMFCGTQKAQKPIISDVERNKILNSLGIDYLCVIDFSEKISRMTGEEFVAHLCTSYNIRAMVVGEDFKCGNALASAETRQIQDYLSRFTTSAFLKVVPQVFLDKEVVSSSLIRRCLLTGDFEKVSKLLGRTYIPTRSDTAVKK